MMTDLGEAWNFDNTTSPATKQAPPTDKNAIANVLFLFPTVDVVVITKLFVPPNTDTWKSDGTQG